jgi:ATP-binding cassette subfamily C protein CydCD
MKLDRRLIHLAWQARVALLGAIASGLAGGLLLIAQAWLLTGVLGDVFLANLTLQDVRTPLAWLLALIILRGALAWISDISASHAAARIKGELRKKVLEHLFARGPAHLRDEQTGEITHTITEGIETLDAYFAQYLPQIALSALIPLAICLVTFSIDPLSGLILLLTGPLIPFFMVLIGSQADAETKKQWQLLSRLSARFLDALQGLTTLKLLGRSKAFANELAHTNEQYRQKTMDVLRVTFLSALALELLATLSTALVAVQMGLRLLYGYISFEQAFFVLLLAPEFYAPLRQLGLRFHAGMAGAAAGGRIFALLEQPANVLRDACSVDSEPQHLSYSTQHATRNTLHFDHVSYTYPDGTSAITDLTFSLQPSTLTILTGPTGSGKSTIVNLLLGFIQPTSGQITRPSTFDLQPFGRLRASSSTNGLPPPIAWVPQTPYLFHDTVAANLRLVNPAASDAELIAAAQLAHADEFIRALPQGYETVIGERGERLSGGQAQRLALARAFLMDAPIVILDEPTAHLDALTEAAILASAHRLAANRIVLIITHRPATIAAADQVIRLKVESLKVEGLQVEKLHVESSPDLRPFDRLRAGTATFDLQLANLQPSNLQPATWLLSFLTPLAPRVLLSALLGFATIAAGVGLMGTSAYVIAAAALHPSIAALQVAIVGVRFFGLSRGVLRYLERLVSHDTTFRVLGRLRVWFYRAVEPLSPVALTDIHSGDLLGRAIGDINLLENFYVRSAAPPLVALLVAGVVSLIVGAFAWHLALALLVMLICQGLLIPLLLQTLGKTPGRQLLTARSHLNVLVVDALQGMADLLACRASERWQANIDAASQAVLAVQARMAQLNGLQNALGVGLSNLGMLLVVTLAIPLVNAGELEGVWLPVLALIALTSFEAVLPLPQAAAHLEAHRQSAARLLALAAQQPTGIAPVASTPIATPFTLNAEHISFTYPSISLSPYLPIFPALTDISFTLPPGKRLAIVGPSGSGKTTLLNLILGFLTPTSGHLSPSNLQPITAAISQRTYLFSDTIRANLLLARPDATPEQIEQAARAAQIHTWITSLPQGYDTWVGEHGLRISGGERQRVGIARALLQDAPLLLLDEPTANLDTATEAALLDALHVLMSERSVIWVTHRLVGMEWMDEILVLDGGRVVERGTHAELLSIGGRYSQMWQAQGELSNNFDSSFSSHE